MGLLLVKYGDELSAAQYTAPEDHTRRRVSGTA
jgi:hypothetical protein